MSKPWKPCRCCGGREVTKTAIVEGLREWVIVECKFCEARRGAYYRKKKETPVKTIRLPPAFYEDHDERDLPTPEDVGKAKSYVLVRADDPALGELLNDAEYYAHPYGPCDAAYLKGLHASAKATVRAIRDVIGWEGAEPAILRLRRPVS